MATVAAATAILTLAPVWLPAPPTTQDGPSHVYNAAIAAQSELPPYASAFELTGGLRPNVAAHGLLTRLGPRLGWTIAERLVMSIAMSATLALAMLLVWPSTLWVLVTGWLASSWFIWMGFYDFALSIPCFLALVQVLRGDSGQISGPVRLVAVHGLLLVLYFTHLFTFAAALALLLVAAALDRSQTVARRFTPLFPATLVLTMELSTEATGGGLIWSEGWNRTWSFLSADYVATVIGFDTAVGVLISGSVLALAVRRYRDMRSGGVTPNSRVTPDSPVMSSAARPHSGASAPWHFRAQPNLQVPLDVFGLAFVAVSFAMPDSIGEGGYVPVRMRFLGMLALLPSLSVLTLNLRPLIRNTAVLVLAALLLARTGVIAYHEESVKNDREALESTLAASGADEGAWLVSRLTAFRVWPVRIGVYRHLAEQVAATRRMIVLNNYEALYGIFRVSWRSRPDWVMFRPGAGTLEAALVPGAMRWDGQIYVVHESGQRVISADSRLAVGAAAANGNFAVTTLRRTD